MVVVLEQFTHHKEIKYEGIAGFVVVVKVGIPVLMSTPVYNCSVDRPHQIVYRQQEEQIPRHIKLVVEPDI